MHLFHHGNHEGFWSVVSGKDRQLHSIEEEYLAFWETAIRTRFRALYFSDDWEWSHGCTFEFAVAWDSGLPTYTQAGQALELAQGIDLIVRAAEALDAEGFDSSGLRENLERLSRLTAR